jgi:hypothetical protein
MAKIWRWTSRRLSKSNRNSLARFIAVAALPLLLLFCIVIRESVPKLLTWQDPDLGSIDSLDHHEAGWMTLRGFDNSLASSKPLNSICQSSTVEEHIGVGRPFTIPDNLTKIARHLEDHPLVKLPREPVSNNTTDGTQSNSWDELATSCAFLNTHQVYLCLPRVVFHPGNPLDKVFIRFLRGRVFDQSWTHQDGYRLSWEGASPITFPTIFDVGTQWRPDGTGLAYGPEDPRIVVEESREPVIVFSMLSPTPEWKRAMHLFRPFTGTTTILTIRGVERPRKEKNWSPFFLSGSHHSDNTVFFVWKNMPLTTIKCGLHDGMCDMSTSSRSRPSSLPRRRSFQPRFEAARSSYQSHDSSKFWLPGSRPSLPSLGIK